MDATARATWMDLVRSHRDSAPTSFSERFSERRWRLLNIDELKQLAKAGMSIGAHTITHPALSLCSQEEARREIQQSKHAIEEAIGNRVWAFAYPFGNPSTMSGREVRMAREAGFSCAFLNVENWRAGSSDAFILPRTHVSRDTALPEFAAHLSGLHSLLQRAIGG